MVSKPKLISAQTANPIVGQRFVSPWLSFKNTAKAVSNNPATTTSSHSTRPTSHSGSSGLVRHCR